MGVLSDALKKIGLGKIRPIAGGVFVLRDKIINLPDGDLAGNRTKHEFRTVVVLSNQTICDSVSCPIVTVVPLSSNLDYGAETDLTITKSKENSLQYDSRLMFGYVQPVLKSDLEKHIGTLNESDWQRVMTKIVWNFDR